MASRIRYTCVQTKRLNWSVVVRVCANWRFWILSRTAFTDVALGIVSWYSFALDIRCVSCAMFRLVYQEHVFIANLALII